MYMYVGTYMGIYVHICAYRFECVYICQTACEGVYVTVKAFNADIVNFHSLPKGWRPSAELLWIKHSLKIPLKS